MGKPRIVITGHKELIRKLKAIGSTRVASRVLRKAANAATNPLLKAVKAETPVDSGALKKSMAKKVGAKNFRVFGIVGSDVSKVGEDGKPIAHHLSLVNNGFEHVGGKLCRESTCWRRDSTHPKINAHRSLPIDLRRRLKPRQRRRENEQAGQGPDKDGQNGQTDQ